MKYLLLLILSFSCLLAQAQIDLPMENGKIIYTEVVTADDKSQDELYASAREWFAKTYNSANNVIQMEDKESGKLVGKALSDVYHKGLGMRHPSGNIRYTIAVSVKDGRYKYEITDFYHTGETNATTVGNCEDMINPSRKYSKKILHHYLEQLNDNTNALIASLKDAMATEVNAASDDW